MVNDNTLRVLLADDKLEELLVAKAVIENIGKKVGFIASIDVVDNVKGVIKQALSANYDIIFTDYNFSKSKTDRSGNGVMVIEEVRKAKPEQEMYILTGEGGLVFVYVKFHAKYLGVSVIKKVWFPRPYSWQKQPEDVDTKGNLEKALEKVYKRKMSAEFWRTYHSA